MIEFQLTIYMCSHCTRVHNAAQDCLDHEVAEHPVNDPTPQLHEDDDDLVDDQSDPTPWVTSLLPFLIADDDVKPVTYFGEQAPSDQQAQTSAMEEISQNSIGNLPEEHDQDQQRVVHFKSNFRQGKLTQSARISGYKYKCERCNYGNNKLFFYRRHLSSLLHRGLGRTRVLLSPDHLFRHVCTKCDYSTDKSGHYRKHQRLHLKREANREDFSCQDVKVVLQEVTHEDGFNKASPDNGQSTSSGIRTRRNNKTIAKHKYQCEPCDYGTDYQKQFIAHTCSVEHQQRNIVSPDHEFQYACPKCRYRTDYHGNFVRHKKVHRLKEKSLERKLGN